MKIIIIYHKNTASIVKLLKKGLLKRAFEFDELVFANINELKEKLTKRTKHFEKDICIVVLGSKKRLFELTESDPLFEQGQLILIVPNKSEETMRLAIKLFPRFIMCTDDSYDDLGAVLDKMLSND